MTREQLRQYQTLKRRQKECLQIMAEMRRDVMYPQAVTIDGMPHGSGKIADPMAEAVASYLQRSQEYAERADDCGRRCREIEETIDTLPDLEREICTLRYIMDWSWQKIAEHTHYSEGAAMYHHRKALAYLATPEELADALKLF